MSSQNPQQKDGQSKVRVMAMRYQQYLKKKQQNAATQRKLGCLKKFCNAAYSSMGKFWNLAMPRLLKGPSTPYQVFLENGGKQNQHMTTNIPLSKMAISQSVKNGYLTLLLTIRKEDLAHRLGTLQNNEQLTLLLKNQAQIFPIFRNPEIARHSAVSIKVNQLLEAKAVHDSHIFEEHILICWKGLFDEILILDFFSLEDPELYRKVIAKIDEREKYEINIRETADDNELSSVNVNMEKSTTLTKDSSGMSS